jgi:galactokinase
MVGEGSVAEVFATQFGRTPTLYRAPGRVNLIGEHTDYNDGFVLPAALELSTWVAIAPREDRTLTLYSALMDETRAFDLDVTEPQPCKDWTDYVRGVAWVLQAQGHPVPGADLAIASDVPLGAGLSSSAALEVAVGYALLAVAGVEIDLTKLALACQRAENEFVGMRCGIMDQFIACHGAAGHALLIDCRSLERRLVQIDPTARLMICNTMVHHAHAAGEYNDRRRDCEEGVARLSKALPRIKALRDVTLDDLQAHADLLTPVVYRRCRHVVTENDRTVRAADALDAGDLALAGHLMNESHVSMRDDFEISCPEVDRMVELNQAVGGVYGARMTGGGFGGCTISLVEAEATETFRDQVTEGYRAATGLEAQIFTCSPGAGVAAVESGGSA